MKLGKALPQYLQSLDNLEINKHAQFDLNIVMSISLTGYGWTDSLTYSLYCRPKGCARL